MKDPHDDKTQELPLTPPVKSYDVLVVWCTGWHKPRLKSHSRWHRGVRATSLTHASQIALACHTDTFSPRVSMIWPTHHQPNQ